MDAQAETTRLTLGPLLFNWPVEQRRDFYFRIADEAPVDTVCVGEVICSKRTPFFAPYLPDVIERLQNAGKEVVLSTLALVSTDRETDELRDAADSGLIVEANDFAAVSLLRDTPFHVGPFVNVYNEATVAYLANRGAGRVCPPVELPAESLGVLARADLTEIEVQAFGRAPLAVSARCYHARAHGLHKDGCQYVCEKDMDGMTVETLDGDAFLAVNGIQTLSYRYLNLIEDLVPLVEAGITRFRLHPHDIDMVAVAMAFRRVLDGDIPPAEATAHLGEIAGSLPFCNGFLHHAEGAALIRPAE